MTFLIHFSRLNYSIAILYVARTFYEILEFFTSSPVLYIILYSIYKTITIHDISQRVYVYGYEEYNLLY